MPLTMKEPAHPGEIVREEVLRPLALSVTDAARALGVTRQSLSALVNERAALSPEMALRLEAAFGIKADLMMRVQLGHSMAEVRARQAEITAGIRRVERSLS